MYFETWITTDQRKLPETIALHGNVFTQDNMANLIGVVLKNDGANVDIDGSVVGYAIRADKNTVIINGEKEGNRAWVILPEAAYAYPGPLSVVIRVVNGDDKTVIGACSGYVTRSISGSPVDPGHVIPDISELIGMIEECEEAAGDANDAAALANTKAGIADTAATRANNAAAAANTAADNANAKASLANTAATNANTKATLADQKAALANTAAEAADQAADAATDAAAAANAAAEAAQTAAESAAQAVAGAVKYSEAQTLTAAQQAQARANIGAGDAEDVADLKSAIENIDIQTIKDGISVPNEVLDPEFKDINDSSKTQFAYWTTKTVADGVLTVVKNSTGQARTTIKTGILENKNITYCAVWVKFTPSSGVIEENVAVVNHSGRNVYLTQNDYDKWVKVSFVGAVVSSGPIATLGVAIQNSNTSPQYTVQIKRPLIVDMTKYFGKGNELSLQEADAFFGSYDKLKTTNQVYVEQSIYDKAKNVFGSIVAENINPYGNYFSPAAFNQNKNNTWWNTGDWSDTYKRVAGDGNKNYIRFGGGVFKPDDNYGSLVGSEAGDLYYMGAMVRTDCDFQFIRITHASDWQGTTNKADYTGEKDTWIHVSHVFAVTGVHYFNCAITYENSTLQSTANADFKCGILINLTKTFGKGYEPSKEQMDAMLSRFDGYWFTARRPLFSAEITRFINDRVNIEPLSRSSYGFDENGAFLCKSHIDSRWPAWKNGRYGYGQNTNQNKIYSKFDHTLVSDGMFISDGKSGAWSSESSGQDTYGGHVFHGWNEIGTYRLTLMIGNSKVGGISREDEAAIIVYSPNGCFSNPNQELTEWQQENRITPVSRDYYGGNSNLILGRIRLGSDLRAEGLLIERKRFTHFGDIVQTNDGQTFRKLKFNNDGSITWEDCTSEMNDPS